MSNVLYFYAAYFCLRDIVCRVVHCLIKRHTADLAHFLDRMNIISCVFLLIAEIFVKFDNKDERGVLRQCLCFGGVQCTRGAGM